MSTEFVFVFTFSNFTLYGLGEDKIDRLKTKQIAEQLHAFSLMIPKTALVYIIFLGHCTPCHVRNGNTKINRKLKHKIMFGARTRQHIELNFRLFFCHNLLSSPPTEDAMIDNISLFFHFSAHSKICNLWVDNYIYSYRYSPEVFLLCSELNQHSEGVLARRSQRVFAMGNMCHLMKYDQPLGYC